MLLKKSCYPAWVHWKTIGWLNDYNKFDQRSQAV
jgi:hypothetical protein